MRFGKRGVSAVIASVLLILLVLVLSSIIFSFARGFVNEQTENSDVSAAQLCSILDFSVVVINHTGINYNFEVVNRGNVNISSLKFKIFSDGGSDIVDFNTEILAGKAVVGSVVLSGTIDKVEVLGVLAKELVGKPSDVVCEDDSVYLKGV